MAQITGTPLTAGTYKPTFIVTDSAGNTSNPVELDITIGTPGGIVPAMFPLPLAIELLINNVWTDVTEFVYQRDDIHITGGRTDRSGQVNPAQCTLTFNNRDGRFSPNFVNGAYYPDLQRNTQIRISLVAATSSSGNTYTGYRFWGEVAEWPPVSDISGNDVYVSITANGPLRRAAQGGGEGSALTRYYASLTGDFAPVVYWPAEEDPDSQQIGSGLQGGVGMVVTQGSPVWKSVSNFNGSAPIGVLNRSTWDGVTPAGAGVRFGNDVFDAPGTYQWTAPVSTVQVNCWGAGGGGSNGFFSNRGGGGGGEFARNGTMAVTIGSTYALTVGNGGSGGAGSYTLGLGGQPGSNSTFTGDSGVTVTAHGGKGGGVTGGAGGTGSGAPVHHNGGTGGVQTGSPPSSWGGGGGAGSGGNSAAGNNGGNSSTNAPGAAATAVTGGGGGGSGGTGGFGSPPATPGFNGKSPGGGGGGSGFNSGLNYGKTGGAGNNGQVQLLYSPTGLVPPANIIRFIMFVPEHGGNPNGVLIRAFTGGTINRVDVQYRNGGNIRLFGYDGGGGQLFDSGNLNVFADGRTLMVSAELLSNAAGTAVNWSLSAIAPGSPGVGNQVVTGTLASAVMGGVTEVLAGPNQDITTTAIGHISVQYAFQPLWVVSQALDGHVFEGGAERFTRLANEQAMGQITEYAETVDHWGFEDGTTQSWAAANGTLSNSGSLFFSTSGVSVNIPSGPFVAEAVPQLWPSEGFKSLLLTANGSGSPSATSLAGASGQPVQPGDVASVAIDLYSPTGISHAYVGLKWYDITGTFISETDSDAGGLVNPQNPVLPAGQPVTYRLAGKDAVAPAGAQFIAVTFGDHHTDTSGTLLYADHVRLSPHMGPQTRKAYRAFLEEIEDLDQGILKEAKEFWGMKMRTRIRLVNQNPSVNLVYSQGMLSPPLTPVLDTQHVRNNVLVHRHKGSTVEVTLNDGQMSIREPPAGVGRFKKTLKTVANSDEQLAAIASWLLAVGTFPDERYPTITVNLGQASFAGNALAPLMSAVAGVEVGDMVQLGDPLPFWYPSPTSQQMVIGYDETINANGWTITWNCITYTPFIQTTTSLRRW